MVGHGKEVNGMGVRRLEMWRRRRQVGETGVEEGDAAMEGERA